MLSEYAAYGDSLGIEDPLGKHPADKNFHSESSQCSGLKPFNETKLR